MHNHLVFIENNPNPIIELNKNTGEILYLNAAARIQFSSLAKDSLYQMILDNLGKIKNIDTSMGLGIMVREVSFYKVVYEQQIFCLPGQASVFIQMTDVTSYKKTAKVAENYLREAMQKESESQTKMENLTDQLNASVNILSAANKQYHLALQAGRAAIWYWQVASDVWKWDVCLNKLLELPENITTGNFDIILKTVHLDDKEELLANIKQAWQEKIECCHVFRVGLSNGLLRKIQLRGHVYTDKYDHYMGLTGTCFDVS